MNTTKKSGKKIVKKGAAILGITAGIAAVVKINKSKKNKTTTLEEKEQTKKKILFLVNHDVVIYNFRLEIVERFIADGHEVHISSPYGERIDDLVALGAIFHEIEMDRHGMNPKEEIKIYRAYKKLLKEVKPDIVFGFTIKPNICNISWYDT